jgi:hypothetical protein
MGARPFWLDLYPFASSLFFNDLSDKEADHKPEKHQQRNENNPRHADLPEQDLNGYSLSVLDGDDDE